MSCQHSTVRECIRPIQGAAASPGEASPSAQVLIRLAKSFVPYPRSAPCSRRRSWQRCLDATALWAVPGKCNVQVLVLGNGMAGAENQAIALLWKIMLAARGKCNIRPVFVRVLPDFGWSLLPAPLHVALAAIPCLRFVGIPHQVRPGRAADGSTAGRDGAAHAWTGAAPVRKFPDVVIASGRTTAPASVAIRRASARFTYTVQIQDPRCWGEVFDAIVTPLHDILWRAGVRPGTGEPFAVAPWTWFDGQIAWGGRMIGCIGALHDVDGAWCACGGDQGEGESRVAEARKQAIRWIRGTSVDAVEDNECGVEVVSVLVGGRTRRCPWTTQDLLCSLSSLLARTSAHEGQGCRSKLMGITLSRRSPVDLVNAVKEWAERHTMPGSCRVYCPDGQGGSQSSSGEEMNPYASLVLGADVVAVTADSVTMVSEACALSSSRREGGVREVLVIGHGRSKGKLRLYHELMTAYAGSRPLAHSHAATASRAGIVDREAVDCCIDDAMRVAKLLLPEILKRRGLHEDYHN